MAFIQKDKHSRKDKLDQAAAGPAPKRSPRVVIHRTSDGKSHMHLDIPEGGMNKEAHLEALLDRIQAKRAEDDAATED